MKWIASSLYGGGSDTVSSAMTTCQWQFSYLLNVIKTVSAIATFFVAMVLHPEVLSKAQEELDRVIGRDKLPCLLDIKTFSLWQLVKVHNRLKHNS